MWSTKIAIWQLGTFAAQIWVTFSYFWSFTFTKIFKFLFAYLYRSRVVNSMFLVENKIRNAGWLFENYCQNKSSDRFRCWEFVESSKFNWNVQARLHRHSPKGEMNWKKVPFSPSVWRIFICILSIALQLMVNDETVSSKIKTAIRTGRTICETIDVQQEKVNNFHSRLEDKLNENEQILDSVVMGSLNKIWKLEHLHEYFKVLKDISDIRCV